MQLDSVAKKYFLALVHLGSFTNRYFLVLVQLDADIKKYFLMFVQVDSVTKMDFLVLVQVDSVSKMDFSATEIGCADITVCILDLLRRRKKRLHRTFDIRCSRSVANRRAMMWAQADYLV